MDCPRLAPARGVYAPLRATPPHDGRSTAPVVGSGAGEIGAPKVLKLQYRGGYQSALLLMRTYGIKFRIKSQIRPRTPAATPPGPGASTEGGG